MAPHRTGTREIVSPVKNASFKGLPPTAVLVASQPDLADLRKMALKEGLTSRSLYNSNLYWNDEKRGDGFVLCGPMVGAPYAVMIMETLAAWGVTEFIFFGWCGAISDKVKCGDIILPQSAYIDEGTSAHYQELTGALSAASLDLVADLEQILKASDIDFHKGPIWTTDAIFRETEAKVAHFQQKGAIGVEMELSALFSAARFRKLKAAGILAVSDTLADFVWRPGFKEKRFKTNRRRICEVINSLCRQNRLRIS
jgi:purine-nucleoside phosphorylase